MNGISNFTQAYSQTPWRKQVQILVQVTVALIMAAVVASLFLNVSARATKIGKEIQNLEDEKEELQKQNADLQSQLAFLSSSEVMNKRAEALGFKPRLTEQTLYMIIPGYIERQPARLATTSTRPIVVAAAAPEEYTESLLTWLQKQLGQSNFSNPFGVKP